MRNMEFPLVSAIITTHERLELVRMAIASVQKQSYPNLELIVVDDASAESIRLSLEEQATREGFRYLYIKKEDSRGGNHARNLGIQASQGKYVAFLDDDDEWLPEKIAKQIAFLQSHEDYKVVACARTYETDFTTRKTEDCTNLICGDMHDTILNSIPYVTSSLVVEKATLLQIGMFDETIRFWQEYELVIRLCQVSPLGVVPEALLLYRIIHKDKNRLTNNLNGWDQAVQYIETKHAELIANAPKAIRQKHKAMIAIDGARRAYRVGEKKKCRYYLKCAFRAKPTFKGFLKWMMGRGRHWRQE